MRIDIRPVIDSAAMLLEAIGRRDAGPVRSIAGAYLASLPHDDFADPAPGMSICTSMPEYQFKELLPYLRGTVRRWHEWAADVPADAEWPEPTRLRAVIGGLREIGRQLGVESTEPVSSEAATG